MSARTVVFLLRIATTPDEFLRTYGDHLSGEPREYLLDEDRNVLSFTARFLLIP
jgi:hypothetical protein